LIATIALIAVGISAWAVIRPIKKVTAVMTTVTSTKTSLPSLTELAAMTPQNLESVDIALMNLRCAEGLRGSEGLDIPAALKVLDQYAEQVRSETTRNFHRYRDDPAEYDNSEAFYRLMILAVVLQEDFGVRYNPKWIASPQAIDPNDDFCASSQNLFIHSLTGPPMTGTCSSMPVLYVAVGRRLGYPLYLVTTKGHVFARWEDGRTRLNIEGTTARGLGSFEDDYYKTFPFKVTDAEIEAEHLLKSMTPNEELAEFVAARAECLIKMRRYADAVKAQRETVRLAPHIRHYRTNLAYSEKRLRQFVMELQQRQIDQVNWLLDHKGEPMPAHLRIKPDEAASIR
jgi:hypothetical protein